MSSGNSLSNVEGGDNCHTCHVLRTAIKGLNLRSDFYNTARCIHNDNNSNFFHTQVNKSMKNNVLTKSADDVSHFRYKSVKSSRSEKGAPVSDRSCYSIETFKTFAIVKDNNGSQTSTSEDLTERDVAYVEEDQKYKNLTPFEMKLQKDMEAYQLAKRQAFEKWFKRKEEERKARHKKKAPVVEIKMSSEEREEAFRRWCERKNQLIKDQKHRKLMERQRMEEERIRALEGKEEKIKEWLRKKSQMQKEKKRKQREDEMRMQKLKEMRKRESEEAYKKWLQQAKFKPLPVPLNKGELSMKGSLTKMYINPEPWKNSIQNLNSSESNVSD